MESFQKYDLLESIISEHLLQNLSLWCSNSPTALRKRKNISKSEISTNNEQSQSCCWNFTLKKSKLCWIPSCLLNLLSYYNFVLRGVSHTLAQIQTGSRKSGCQPSKGRQQPLATALWQWERVLAFSFLHPWLPLGSQEESLPACRKELHSQAKSKAKANPLPQWWFLGPFHTTRGKQEHENSFKFWYKTF